MFGMTQEVSWNSEILTRLKYVAGDGGSSEDLFGIVLDLHSSSLMTKSTAQLEMCENVMEKLISYVEVEARRRISDKIAAMEDAPRKIVRLIAVEPIYVAEPVLKQSPVLEDADLLYVSRLCGVSHLEAIAHREEVSQQVTNELVRHGNLRVWEQVACNSGAKLSEKALQFLINRSKESSKIQMGLIDRPDLAEGTIHKIVKDAGENIRAKLIESGRQDLLSLLPDAQTKASQRVLSTSSTLGFEFENAMMRLIELKKRRPVTKRELVKAINKGDFPFVAAIFSDLSGLDIDEAVHWLSRREIDPAIVALRALGFERSVVESLLNVGPWRVILTQAVKVRALKTFDQLSFDVAERIFNARSGAFSANPGNA